MKIVLFAWIYCLLFLGLPVSFFGQTTNAVPGVVFPESTREFSVVFPRAPRIQTVYADGFTGKQAELSLNDCFLRAEVMELSDEQASDAAKNTETQRAEIAHAYARANGLSNAAVTSGVNELGRFAKLRGNKVIQGVNITFESIFIWGYKQAFTLTVGGSSSRYPQQSITTFLNSVRSPGQTTVPKGINISVDRSKLVLGALSTALPSPKSEIFKAFGSPSRQTSKLNTIYTWDNLGVVAYETPNTGMISQVSVVLNNLDMNYDFFPRKTFSGKLTVDGINIVKHLKGSNLNIGRTTAYFSKVQGLPFLREMQLGNLKITAGYASELEYIESGNLIEVSIQAR